MYPKKLLDTNAGNLKIKKTQKLNGAVRIASLSMYPDDILCPWSNVANCRKLCLKSAGRGRFENVKDARIAKKDYYHAAPEMFLNQLRRELFNFIKVCERDNLQAVARLNVLSDVAWERHEIPQQFPELFMYDYTKTAFRLGKTPDNYALMFSYSAEPEYQDSVSKALKTNVPLAVVFDKVPVGSMFLDREVINGDQSDLLNVQAGPVVVGLKYKITDAYQSDIDNSRFIVRAA
tara:strand:- start:259 stop:960 length:702 start_codon:yes stop_codon:yes gene_type:complete